MLPSLYIQCIIMHLTLCALLGKGDNGRGFLPVKNVNLVCHWLCNNIQAEGYHKDDHLFEKPVLVALEEFKKKTLGTLTAHFNLKNVLATQALQ